MTFPYKGAIFSFSDNSVPPCFLSSSCFFTSNLTKSSPPPSHTSIFTFFLPQLPLPNFSLSGAPVPLHSSLRHRFPLLRCMEAALALFHSVAPWAEKWAWTGPLLDVVRAGPEAGNAPVTRGERAWLPRRLSRHLPGIGHRCGRSGLAVVPFD